MKDQIQGSSTIRPRGLDVAAVCNRQMLALRRSSLEKLGGRPDAVRHLTAGPTAIVRGDEVRQGWVAS
jgi:hypothetical protein